MRIGLYVGSRRGPSLDRLIEGFVEAERLGFATAWVGQTNESDALTLLALAGRATETIELGSWVVPVFSRHPVALAQAARTTQLACSGRLLLGIGVSHRAVVENQLGLDYDRPRARMAELLQVLPDLLLGERVEYRGATLRIAGQLDGEPVPRLPIFLAALGPRMLELAGARADGVAIWLGGRGFVEDFARARVDAGARLAGRSRPRLAVGLPIAVTRAVDALASIERFLGPSVRLPAYRQVIARQGTKCVGDVAIVGDEDTVVRHLDDLADAGVTDFNAILTPIEGDAGAIERTRALLADRARTRDAGSPATLA